MATVFSHAVAAAGLASLSGRVFTLRLVLLGTLCSIIPDLDVVGFHFGVHYGDLLGHRGLTHSIIFAFLLSGGLAVALRKGARLTGWVYLFTATLSHGLLDAMTDGGLGVAFFAPFNNERFFFPFRPIHVSPIGAGFFSARGWDVIQSEMFWIWLPVVLILITACLIRRSRHA